MAQVIRERRICIGLDNGTMTYTQGYKVVVV